MISSLLIGIYDTSSDVGMKNEISLLQQQILFENSMKWQFQWYPYN